MFEESGTRDSDCLSREVQPVLAGLVELLLKDSRLADLCNTAAVHDGPSAQLLKLGWRHLRLLGTGSLAGLSRGVG